MLKPFVSIGFMAALVEAMSEQAPGQVDFESLNEDILSIRGFYKNKITRMLLVFFLASMGGAIGNFISVPMLARALVR